MTRHLPATPLTLVTLLTAACAERVAVQATPTAPSPPPAITAPSTAPVEPTTDSATNALRTVFPHVRIDQARTFIEFDGVVPINAADPNDYTVFLETVVCTFGTKEHESLIATEARPSHVHAALLLLGLEPGVPGAFRWEGQTLIPIPPTGDPVTVTIIYTDASGVRHEVSAADWIVNANDARPLGGGSPRWVFAGSRFVQHRGEEFYDADGAGTLIGLATFGSETIAYADPISHEAAVTEPEWIARNGALPPFNTPVIVRITR